LSHRKQGHSRVRTKALGQHLLRSGEIADRIVSEAQISVTDLVLEIGTGLGILTRRLAEKADRVRTYEIDPEMCKKAERLLLDLGNVELLCKDAFLENPEFDVCVTSLPYSESLRFVKWISSRKGFKRIVAIVQKEFADKLSSPPGVESYRAVSVLVQHTFDLEKLGEIQRDEFSPIPRVSSELIRLTPKDSEPFFNQERLVLLNRLFSYRRKTLSAALRKIRKGIPIEIDFPFLNKRVEQLSPLEFSEIIKVLEKESNG
jgi:16S rRNA (adenine1518-N6/adenine1519-N6)-dimethyltransferase